MPKFLKKLDAKAEIPKKSWSLGPKFLKNLSLGPKFLKKVVARA